MCSCREVLRVGVLATGIWLLCGCGGGGDSAPAASPPPTQTPPPPAPVFVTGRVRAVSVVGLTIESSGRTSTTPTNGAFEYVKQGDPMTVALRKQKFGTIPAASLVTVFGLSPNPAAASLIARFVASIDEDKNLATGITFSANVLAFLDQAPAVDFTAAGAEANVRQLLVDLSSATGGTYELIAEADLLATLGPDLSCARAGVFVGAATGSIWTNTFSLPVTRTLGNINAPFALAVMPPSGLVRGEYSGQVKAFPGSNVDVFGSFYGSLETTQGLPVVAQPTFTALSFSEQFTGTVTSSDAIDFSWKTRFNDDGVGSAHLERRNPAANVRFRFVRYIPGQPASSPTAYVLLEIGEDDAVQGVSLNVRSDVDVAKAAYPVFAGNVTTSDTLDVQTDLVSGTRLRYTGTLNRADAKLTGGQLIAQDGRILADGDWQGCMVR